MALIRIFMVVLLAACIMGQSKCSNTSTPGTHRAPVPQPGLDQADYQLGCPGGTGVSTTAATIDVVQVISLNAFCSSLPGSLPAGTGPGLQDPRYHVAPGNFVGPLKITPNCVSRVLTIEAGANTVVASFASDGSFIIPNIPVAVPFSDDKFSSQSCLATLIANLRGTVTCPAVAVGNVPTVFQNAVIALTVDWGYQSVSGVPPIPSQPRKPPAGPPNSQAPCTIASTCVTSQFISLSCGR